MKDDSEKVKRWLLQLQKFDLELKHMHGYENLVADALIHTVIAVM